MKMRMKTKEILGVQHRICGEENIVNDFFS